MATVQDLYAALKAADAAGNVEDAQKLAATLSNMGYGSKAMPVAPVENKSGLIPATTSSFRAGLGETTEALGELTGLEALSKLGKEQREKAAGMYTPTTEADVEAAKAKGILPAAGAYMSKYLTEPVGEAVGSIAGRYGAPMGIAAIGGLNPELAIPMAVAGFGTNAAIHTGENLLRQKEQGQAPDYKTATAYGIGQAAVDQFAGHIVAGPMKSIIGRTAVQEAELLVPRVLKGEMTADQAALMVGGKLRNVLQATGQNAVVGAGMMTADEAMRRASAGQDTTSPEALEIYKQQALTAAELSPLFGLHQGLGQPAKARAVLEAAERMRPPPPPPPAAEPPPPSEPPLLGGPKPTPPGEPPALPFNPLPGTPTVFPDGTVALTPEDALARRYAPQAGTTQEKAPQNIEPSAPLPDAVNAPKQIETNLEPAAGAAPEAIPEAAPEAKPSEQKELQAKRDDLTKQMDALRIAKTGKPPTPLSKAGKQFAELAAQRDEVTNRLAEIAPEPPPFEEATPIEGKPALVEPEEKAEYEAKAKELKQALKETKSDLSKTKREGYSLFQHLRGMLNANEISKRDDPQYKQLIAKNGKQGVALSTLIEDGHLNDFLPMDNLPGMPNFDWQKAEEHIREKLYSKNYVTTETEMAVKNLGRKIEDIENQIDKHLTLKDINGLLQEAADEQRTTDQATEAIAPEGENRAAAPSEAAPAEELTLTGETPEEVRAKQTAAEARAAEEARATKEAEAKAKADAEVGEFTLTGSDREADLAASRGQRDIFAEEKRAQASDTRAEVPDAKPERVAPPTLKPPEGFKLKKGRNEQVVLAARELEAGRITKAEYDRYVNFHTPIETIAGEKLESPIEKGLMKKILTENLDPKDRKKPEKVDANIADGTRVGLRMDIPALNWGKKNGVNGSVVSIHKGKAPNTLASGENLSYKSAGHITDAVFAPRSEESAFKIARGLEGKEGQKKPQQTIEGKWVNTSPEEIFSRVKKLMDDPAWTQISLDPLRHSFFYDRADGRPVLSADEVLQVGRFVLAKNVQYGERENFKYMQDLVKRKATPEQIADRDERVKKYGGDVIYQNGEMGVYRTFSENLKPLYRAFKNDTRLTSNLEQYTGNLFTAKERATLAKVIEDWKKADVERFKKDPFVKFDKDGVAFSQNVPADVAGVFKGWKNLLKLDKNIYLTTIDDANANRLLFTGDHAAIGTAGLHGAPGVMTRLANGDYFIAFRSQTSKARMFEILAHEMGHVHELEVFNKLDDATKADIKDEYESWLGEQKGRMAKDLVESLRARKVGKTTDIEPGLTVQRLDDYWTSFTEWYADQTARWATTQEKPLTVVEKFFSKLGAAMKAFYAKVRNGKYLPNQTFREYMDRVTESAMDAAKQPENMKPLVSDQMEMRFMMDGMKERAQQMLQKRAPMNQKGFSHVDQATVDEVNRHFFAPNKTVIDRIDSLKGRMWEYVAQKMADEFRSIKGYSRLGHMLATLSKDTNGALESLLFHGHVKLEGGALDVLSGPDKKGLIEALKPIGNELDTFHVWMALNREANLPENQRSHDLDALVAKKDDFIKGNINGRPREQVYKEVQKDVMAINKSVLGVALQTGLIDRFAYNRFAKDEFYIPFYRMLEDGKIESMNQAARLTGKEFSKMLKGNNDKPFGDLMENTLRNWSHILSASMKNQAANVTIEAAREQGAVRPALKPGLAWETDADGTNGRVVSATTGKIVGDGGLVQERTNEAGETQLVSMTEAKTGAKDVVRTQVDGVTTYHHVEDPLLFESVAAVSGGGPKGIAIDIMQPFKELLRFGVTASPMFKVSNLVKDSIQSAALSDLSGNVLKNVYTGLYDARKGSPIYQSALAGGGIFNYGSALEGDRSAAIRKLIARGVNEATILDTPEKVKNFFSTAWHKYEELGNLSEAANRVALYKQLKDKGYSHLEASFHARDLMNFSATGSSNAIRFVSATVPFFNARIQGLYKLGRDGINPTARVLYNTVTGKPLDVSDVQKAKAFSGVTGAVCLASIALYLANKDDKDFQKREQWDRDNFWWSKIPGTDHAIRIPKPFELGALATLTERTVEQIADSSVEGKRFADSLSRMVWQTFSLNPVPQAFKPLVDIYANKNYFTNAPIETAGMEKLSKQERMTDTTSPLAKALGGVSHAMAPLTGDMGELSPVQIDYMIRAYMGWLGGTVAATTAEAVKPFNNGVYPSTDWTKPLTLGYIEKEPSPQSAYLTDFYQNNQAIQQAYADMRHYAQLGQSDKVLEIMSEKKNELSLARFYDAQSKQLANIRKQLLTISNPSYTGLTADQKEEEILRLKQLMSSVAEQAESARKSLRVNP
jgi:Large polyvalent protein associated domain 38